MDRPAADDSGEWGDIVRSGSLADEPGSNQPLMEDIMIDADDGSGTRRARGIPEPRQPSKEEVARQPYPLAIRFLVPPLRRMQATKLFSQIFSFVKGRTTVPAFVSDYCFIRKPDEDLLSGLVGRLYPSRAIFSSICDVKGPDDSVVDRLAEFFKNSCITKMVYKSDQEPTIRAPVEAALSKIGRAGDPQSDADVLQLVPELSDVGESLSNGRAERAVQSVEDMTRAYLHALESRLKVQIPTQHPIMRWLFEHAGSMLNRFTLNPDGVSPYAALHGRNCSDRHVEFGEKVFYCVPKRARSKLDLR